jgi:transcriptional regulator with XRE-family HTH domain
MKLGERLRALREEKNLSQSQIEKRTGLLISYISRVERGDTVPSLETLEKLCRALELPLYQLFYQGNVKTKLWGTSGKEARFIVKFRRVLGRIDKNGRKLLLRIARTMADHKRA